MRKSVRVFRDKGLGPGGWSCPCCAPAKRHRKTWMRAVRKRMARWSLRYDPEVWGLC